jgi:hypothetical protein
MDTASRLTTILGTSNTIIALQIVNTCHTTIVTFLANQVQLDAGIATGDTSQNRITAFNAVTEKSIIQTVSIIGGTHAVPSRTSVVSTRQAIIAVTIGPANTTAIGGFLTEQSTCFARITSRDTALCGITHFLTIAVSSIFTTSVIIRLVDTNTVTATILCASYSVITIRICQTNDTFISGFVTTQTSSQTGIAHRDTSQNSITALKTVTIQSIITTQTVICRMITSPGYALIIGASNTIITIAVGQTTITRIGRLLTQQSQVSTRITLRLTIPYRITDLLSVTVNQVCSTIAVIGNMNTTSINTSILGANHSIVTFTGIGTLETTIAIIETGKSNGCTGISARHTIHGRITILGPATETTVIGAVTIVGQILANIDITGVIGTSDAVVTISGHEAIPTTVGSLIANFQKSARIAGVTTVIGSITIFSSTTVFTVIGTVGIVDRIAAGSGITDVVGTGHTVIALQIINAGPTAVAIF